MAENKLYMMQGRTNHWSCYSHQLHLGVRKNDTYLDCSELCHRLSPKYLRFLDEHLNCRKIAICERFLSSSLLPYALRENLMLYSDKELLRMFVKLPVNTERVSKSEDVDKEIESKWVSQCDDNLAAKELRPQVRQEEEHSAYQLIIEDENDHTRDSLTNDDDTSTVFHTAGTST